VRHTHSPAGFFTDVLESPFGGPDPRPVGEATAGEAGLGKTVLETTGLETTGLETAPRRSSRGGLYRLPSRRSFLAAL